MKPMLVALVPGTCDGTRRMTTMVKSRPCWKGLAAALVLCLAAAGPAADGSALAAESPAPATGPQAAQVPVLYSTDLYHPHVDFDDHYDLAQLFSQPEFDIRGIVLDINGNLQRSGQLANFGPRQGEARR